MNGWVLSRSSGTARPVGVRGRGPGAFGPLHVTWREHSLSFLATGCYVPVHQVAPHKLISCAEPYFRISQPHYSEVLAVELEVHIWKHHVGTVQPDEPNSGGHFIIAIEYLTKLVKRQQFDAVRNSCNSHKMANLVLLLGVWSIVKYPLAHHHSHVGNEVAGLGVRLPCHPPSRLPPFLQLGISNAHH